VSLFTRPVIAITGPQRHAFGPRALVALAVRRYGGIPLQLRPRDPSPVRDYHGVVVTGGHDIDPVLYASLPEVEPRHDSERDALESRVIDDALERDLPLLGICRGAQLLNVRRGGNLFQELRSRRQQTSNRWTVLPLKTLSVTENSRLHALLRCNSCRINSLHNQAIDRTGSGLNVVGRDLDNIIQAIEDPQHAFLLGVQWHPEFLLFMRSQRRLFRCLVAAARARLQSA